jgi:hypothetical protein
VHSEWIESDITIWTQLQFQLNIHSWYSNWSVSEDVKQRAQNYLQFSRTEQFEELLLAWMHTVLKHSSLSLPTLACESLFSNRILAWELPVRKTQSLNSDKFLLKLTANQAQEKLGGEHIGISQ